MCRNVAVSIGDFAQQFEFARGVYNRRRSEILGLVLLWSLERHGCGENENSILDSIDASGYIGATVTQSRYLEVEFAGLTRIQELSLN